ncbi:hypothetical protein [Paenibacillus xylanilyticus]|uniref:hypothetical protein n=1 Tax=Paenibacillus xylanilyticus TaxID=248903 RepID=UPI0039A050A6
MKKSDWFYLWIAIPSYLSGPVMYAVTMYIFYKETDVVTEVLLGWTAATFASVVVLFFLLAVILLRVLKIYFFWLQTLLYMVLSLIPVYMTPVLMGSGNSGLPELSFPLSPEGVPLLVFWESIALMSSWGVWAAHKRSNKPLFLLVSSVFLLLFIFEV